MYVLGIDAGGTKTVCLLADDSGRVLAESHGGGANLQASGELAVEKVLHQVMEDTLAQRDVRPDAICLGIAGVDRPNDAQAVQGIMRRIGFKARVTVVNDALVALVAGAGEQAGVVIVAGTGSIAYGVDASNARVAPEAGVTCLATKAVGTGLVARRFRLSCGHSMAVDQQPGSPSSCLPRCISRRPPISFTPSTIVDSSDRSWPASPLSCKRPCSRATRSPRTSSRALPKNSSVRRHQW